MDALLTAFVAALLAEWGDKTQLIVAMLAATTNKPGRVLIALFLAALASNLAAGYAGVFIASTIIVRAMTLMVALALLFAAASALMRRKPPAPAPPRRLLVASAFVLLLAAEFGDRTQFLTFALAGRFDSAPLAAAGATAGTFVACLPAALLGDRLAATVPLRAVRFATAAIFLIAGFITAVQALQLA